ncbi:TetR family transcriptional regulator [Stutzerimonas decontaminans]|uniref:TetR family transcriptional regulator n=1 Tax=Stutzerimonas decontaminans TaxID=3022791 RepID=A0ABX4VUV0_9GAMM|nr:TetR family transcriptional regulator [Stutzerimonas decontaminans]MCQ4246768.1 TetR family transcriptional regulator [Stutzerimonas decontaminans]PNF83802.1 TetR family transcriptional regulator [Stutzerimonas decontaminans]
MRRTKEDAEQTRLKVIAAALELFSRNGYSNTTLAMIAEAAGFSRGPIYWHFKSKDELYEAVLGYSQVPLERLIEQSRELAADPRAALEHFITEWFRLLLEERWYRQSFEILLNKTELTAQMASTLKRERKLTRTMVQLLEEMIAKVQANEESARSLAVLLYSSLMGITHTWLLSPKLFSLREQAPCMVCSLLALVAPAANTD